MKTALHTGTGTYLAYSVFFMLVYMSLAASYVVPKRSLWANADLKGEWTYNEQKSKQGQATFRVAPLKLKITNEANGLAIERTTMGFNGGENMISTEHLTLDGKETESTVFGVMKKKSAATWSADGKQLTVNASMVFDRNGTSTEFKSVEVYSVSDDGKTLTIQYSSPSFATVDGMFVYDRVN
jgi:hypothetical protein